MANPSAHIDLSIVSLFLRADFVVQSIMLGLFVASIVCWGIIVDKFLYMKKMHRAMTDFETVFWSGKSLDEILKHRSCVETNPMATMFISAMHEWRQPSSGDRGMLERIERAMIVVMNKETDILEKNMPILASIGSSAPFIGLLGTVWGIMNSFTAIAASKQTSLAVVAPGIAEALFATALGLFAAIPATIAYNKFSSDIDKKIVRYEGFVSEFVGIISRRIGR